MRVTAVMRDPESEEATVIFSDGPVFSGAPVFDRSVVYVWPEDGGPPFMAGDGPPYDHEIAILSGEWVISTCPNNKHYLWDVWGRGWQGEVRLSWDSLGKRVVQVFAHDRAHRNEQVSIIEMGRPNTTMSQLSAYEHYAQWVQDKRRFGAKWPGLTG